MAGTGNRIEGNKVQVNIDLLSKGLKTTFTGVAMVFESLGTDAAGGIVAAVKDREAERPAATHAEETAEPVDTAPAKPVKARRTSKAKAAEEPQESQETKKPEEAQESREPEQTEQQSAPEPETTQASDPDYDLPFGIQDEPEQKPYVRNVSIDDITRVIVAKIKTDKKNNAKIGELLKTYGVEKVSSLPAEKYEAFITDIGML